jgi:hypothetical protein
VTAAHDKKSRAKANENLFTGLAVEIFAESESQTSWPKFSKLTVAGRRKSGKPIVVPTTGLEPV